jgi:hypothetical protein
MLLLIRLMLHFSTSTDSAALQEWTAAASSNHSRTVGLQLTSAAAAVRRDGSSVSKALPSSVLRVLVLYMQVGCEGDSGKYRSCIDVCCAY